MLDAQGWSRLTELFHQATQLPEDQRARFAEEHTQDAPDVRQELLAMLAADTERTGSIGTPLQRAAEALLRAAEPELQAGTRFGPWAVLHKLASGGMGSVYLAQRADGAYERQVALKLVTLPPSWRDQAQRSYFEYECRLLARMQHPTIAQIHDAGIDDVGNGYLVMEYIHGTTLSRWCNQHTASLRQRVGLLLDVAEGVQHAHQKGVIHRDLKPSNVLVQLVDGKPVPRIIDFGIATAADAGADQLRSGVGTPGYMSPEQAARSQDVDARADIYSLGALLYELLLGRPPEPGSTPLKVWDQLGAARQAELAQQCATTPRQLRRQLATGLDAVITKAMARDREQRYPAMAALIVDLRRWQEQRVPHAQPASRLLAARQFVARNTLSVAAAAVTAFAVLGGLAGTAWALQRAQDEGGRAELTAAFLASILDGADPAQAEGLDKTLMLRVLDDAIERAPRELAAYPDTLADIELILAINYNHLEAGERAAQRLQSVIDLSAQQPKLLAFQRLRALQILGDVEMDRGDIARAEAVLTQGINEAQRSDPRHAWLGLDMQSRRAWVWFVQGKAEQAREQAKQAMERLEALRGSDDQQRLDAVKRYAAILGTGGEHALAQPLLDDVIDRRTRLNGPDHPLTLTARVDRSVLLLQSGQFAAAEPELRDLLARYRNRYSEDTARVAALVAFLGSALREQGKVEEAGPYYRQAMEFNAKQFGPASFSALITRHNHANWLLADGQAQAAAQEQRTVLALARQHLGENTHVVGEVLRNLAEAEAVLGQRTQAVAHANEALAVLRKVYGDSQPSALTQAQATLAKVQGSSTPAAAP